MDAFQNCNGANLWASHRSHHQVSTANKHRRRNCKSADQIKGWNKRERNKKEMTKDHALPLITP
jgi:hypothetical protein